MKNEIIFHVSCPYESTIGHFLPKINKRLIATLHVDSDSLLRLGLQQTERNYNVSRRFQIFML